MLRRTMLWAVFFLAALAGACNKPVKPQELAAGMELGKTYYTQFSLFQEKNNFRTTNYRRGILIPINTAVVLESISSDEAKLKIIGTGQPLAIENVQKHTMDDMQAAFKKIAGPRKVDLSGFTRQEQAGILEGRVQKGMSRQAVLAAIGYPPRHQTPPLESNDWTYWSSLWNRFIVHFKNDKVEKIVD